MHVCTCEKREAAIRLGLQMRRADRPPVYCEDFAECPADRGHEAPARPPPLRPQRPAQPPPPPIPAGYNLPRWARSLRRSRDVFWRQPPHPRRPGYFSYHEYLAQREGTG